MKIFSLLVTTWVHYRRRILDPGGWRLSIEGLDNAIEPERTSQLQDDPLSYREREQHEESGEQKEHREHKEHEKRAERTPDDNIYQGILWMKEKYEQYREQADRRHELLKEELNRSERRYQDLLLSMEENKSSLPPTAALAVVQAQYIQVCQQLDARQLIIDELEEKLRIERLKVREME